MNSKRSLFYASALFIVVVATVVLTSYDRISQDWTLAVVTTLFAASLAFLPFSFRFLGFGRTEESGISSYGLVGTGALLIAATGIAAFSLAYNGQRSGAIVACALLLLLVLGFFFVTSYSAEEIDKISAGKSLRSDHARWAVQLEEIASGTESEPIRLAIQKRATACRYQPRDIPGYASVGVDVEQCIANIATSAGAGRDDDIDGLLALLDRLLERRSNALKIGRSKV